MMCPYCKSTDSYVLDSRSKWNKKQKNMGILWRRRKCKVCDARFSTCEIEKSQMERLERAVQIVNSLSEMLDEGK